MKYDADIDEGGALIFQDLREMIDDCGVWGLLGMIQVIADRRTEEAGRELDFDNWKLISDELDAVMDRLYRNPATDFKIAMLGGTPLH